MRKAVPFLGLVLLACAGNASQSNTKASAPRVPPSALAQAAPIILDASPSACPSDMVEIDGDFCPTEEQVCLYNTDERGKRITDKPVNPLWSCGEFKPGRCLSATVHLHYCIDKYEWPNKAGQKPQDWMTWYDAKRAVESVGKRLCTSHEWTLAAEGPHNHPLPYGDGYHRDGSCNIDNINPGIDVFKARKADDEASHSLRAFLVESGSMPDCASDYGVYDMAGNIDEWVVNEHSKLLECPKEIAEQGKCKEVEYRSGLKGGHIWHVRQAGRPMTVSHNASFGWYETGTRACKDISQ